jgi:hypothetical protein
MANKHVIIANFPSAALANEAANQIKTWDKADDAIKLGGIGVLTWEDGKVKTQKIGARATGAGAKWGTILGVATGILSGGVTLIGGALAGAVGGGVLGSFFHKNLGLSDADKARLESHLQTGGATLVVMADDHEVAATSAQLASLGGAVENYEVPAETVAQVEAAEVVQSAEEEAAAAAAAGVGAVDAAKDAGADVVDATKDATAGAVDAAKDMGADVADAAKDATAGAVDAAKDMGADVVDATKDATAGAVDAAKDAGADVADAAKDATAGAVDAAKDAGADVADAAKDAASDVADAAKDVLPGKSAGTA